MRVAPSDGKTCDNLCRQIRIDPTTCKATNVDASGGVCGTVDTPEWNPQITGQLEDGVCTVTLGEESSVTGTPDLCACENGSQPCDCSSVKPAANCQARCPVECPTYPTWQGASCAEQCSVPL